MLVAASTRTHRRKALGLLIVLILAGDVATVLARQLADPGQAAPPPEAAAPTSTVALPPPLILRDEFDASTAYKSAESDRIAITTGDGQFHVRFKASLDIYPPVPPEASQSARIKATADLSVEVEARSAAGAPANSFGVICRSHGLDNDTYLAEVTADGEWTIARATLGTGTSGLHYERRALATGREPGFVGGAPPSFVFRIRLECVGRSPAVLRLFINGRQVGQGADASGLDPGDAGMFAHSAVGDLVFDNLVITELR